MPGCTRAQRGFPVDLNDLVQVLAEVHDDGVVHSLPCQARSAGARQHRHAVLASYLDHRLHVGGAAGDDHAHWLHLVNAGVGAVKHA